MTKLLVGSTQSLSIQIFRYLIVGGIAFIVDFLLLYLLTHFLSLPVLVSAAISFMVGLVVNYRLSMTWIFTQSLTRSAAQKSKEFFIFFITGISGLGLNELCLYLFTEALEINYLISKLITVPIVILWNFFSRRHLLTRSNHD